MYILAYAKNNLANWEYLQSKELVENRVKELIRKGYCNEDMMIFQENYAVPKNNGSFDL